MKKVIALALAVLMLATVAFAADAANIRPGKTMSISRQKVDAPSGITITAKTDGGKTLSRSELVADLEAYIPRSVNSTNYSVTNVKFKLGKGLVTKVELNDVDDCVDIVMADDLTNTKAKNFEVSFKLKGKAKYTLKDPTEVDSYNLNQYTEENAQGVSETGTRYIDTSVPNAGVNTKVSLPNLDFEISGTVGYGQVTIYLGQDGDEEIESLVGLVKKGITEYSDEGEDDILDGNIFQFKRSGDLKEHPAGDAEKNVPMAGSYTADALLTQEYGDALTMEARVYHNDKIYFGIAYTPDRNIVNRLADADGDLDFYRFNSNKEFVTFNSNCKLYFNDADEDSFVYKVNDNGYLVPAGSYSDEDGCWVVSTRTLGTYVVSDIELDDTYVVADGDPETTNPDTGANDVVGIATALAAVALVSAAAISLKK